MRCMRKQKPCSLFNTDFILSAIRVPFVCVCVHVPHPHSVRSVSLFPLTQLLNFAKCPGYGGWDRGSDGIFTEKNSEKKINWRENRFCHSNDIYLHHFCLVLFHHFSPWRRHSLCYSFYIHICHTDERFRSEGETILLPEKIF